MGRLKDSTAALAIALIYIKQRRDEMTPAEDAKQAFNDGLQSSDNPYCLGTSYWCEWAKEFGRLNDEWVSEAVSDES